MWRNKIMTQSDYKKWLKNRSDDKRDKTKKQCNNTKWCYKLIKKVMTQSDETIKWYKFISQSDYTRWWQGHRMTKSDGIKW